MYQMIGGGGGLVQSSPLNQCPCHRSLHASMWDAGSTCLSVRETVILQRSLPSIGMASKCRGKGYQHRGGHLILLFAVAGRVSVSLQGAGSGPVCPSGGLLRSALAAA